MNWGFTSKLFLYAIDNLDYVMPNFGKFSDKFDNFKKIAITQYHVIYVDPDTPDICLDTPGCRSDIRSVIRIFRT